MSQIKVSTGIGTDDRIPEAVHVAVIALHVVRILDIRIRTDEPADEGIVDPPIHMNDADLVDMLVVGKAPVGIERPNGIA